MVKQSCPAAWLSFAILALKMCRSLADTDLDILTHHPKFRITIPWLIIIFHHFPLTLAHPSMSSYVIDGELFSAAPRPEFCRGERLGTGGLERTFSRRTAPGSPSGAADAGKTIPGLQPWGGEKSWAHGAEILAAKPKTP